MKKIEKIRATLEKSSQLNTSTFSPTNKLSVFGDDISHSFDPMTNWMNEFFFRLNSDKTKILAIRPPSPGGEIVIQGTFINNKCVRFVYDAKIVAVTVDDELSFKNQIVKVVKSCFLVIRRLSKIKDYLTYDQLRTSVCACVFSKLDYCNALYYGVDCLCRMV